jgi:hypothetical protein
MVRKKPNFIILGFSWDSNKVYDIKLKIKISFKI